MSTKNAYSVLFALLLGIACYALIILFYEGGGKNDEDLGRFLVLLGAGSKWGLIQFLTYILFFWCIFEILYMSRAAAREESVLAERILPERSQYVMNANEVAELKLKVLDRERNNPRILHDLIIKACTKYRNNKSTSEAMEVIATQSRINLSRWESDQSMVRFTLWAMPSVGFVGTVIGIALSLSLASDTSPEGIKKITAALNVAFDTTLVALVLNIIGALLYHRVQARVEKLHADLEAYVLENLINRIY